MYEQEVDNQKIGYKVVCDSCGSSWPESFRFCEEQKEAGNRIIRVDILRQYKYAGLWSPEADEVPFSGLVRKVLNSALMTKFNLEVCLACEGGVEKKRGRVYSLENDGKCIGLYAEYGEDNAQKALAFYEALLKKLFIEKINFAGHQFRRGEILWLKEEEKYDKSNAMLSLFMAMASVGGRSFARKTIRQMNDKAKDPFFSTFVGGLSDEDIARIFVPPPLG